MDVSQLLQVAPAPRAVFDRLATHRHRVRFQVRTAGAWEPVTWGQFALQIRGVARWLVEHDLEPGERIAIYGHNSVAWASAALGAQTAGAVFVPIYPASTPEQVAYILEHADIKYVFVAGKDCQSRLERAMIALPVKPQVVDLEGAAWPAGTAITDDNSIRAAASRDAAAPTLVDARLGALELDQPAQMLYTSGTSGNPKGVPLTHRNVGTNGADWLVCNAPLLSEGDRDLLLRRALRGQSPRLGDVHGDARRRPRSAARGRAAGVHVRSCVLGKARARDRRRSGRSRRRGARSRSS
jgi:long-chain acyl-CoA synthetase